MGQGFFDFRRQLDLLVLLDVADIGSETRFFRNDLIEDSGGAADQFRFEECQLGADVSHRVRRLAGQLDVFRIGQVGRFRHHRIVIRQCRGFDEPFVFLHCSKDRFGIREFAFIRRCEGCGRCLKAIQSCLEVCSCFIECSHIPSQCLRDVRAVFQLFLCHDFGSFNRAIRRMSNGMLLLYQKNAAGVGYRACPQLSSGERSSQRRWGSGNLLCSCERMLAGAGREIEGCPPSSNGSSEVQTWRSPQLRRGGPRRRTGGGALSSGEYPSHRRWVPVICSAPLSECWPELGVKSQDVLRRAMVRRRCRLCARLSSGEESPTGVGLAQNIRRCMNLPRPSKSPR